MRTMLGWLLMLLLVGLVGGSAEASALQSAAARPIHPQSIVSQSEKEAWLLEAVVSNDRPLAYQIASQRLTVDYQGQILVVRGLNVDLGYRGRAGTPLYQVLQRRAHFYRHHSSELHRDLTDPDRVVHLSVSVDARNILIPGSVSAERSYELDGRIYTQIGQKLYRSEYRLLHDVPQLVLHYDPEATTTYASKLATTTPTSQLSVTSRDMTDAEYDYWYGQEDLALDPDWIE